jgi:hypothetical protein
MTQPAFSNLAATAETMTNPYTTASIAVPNGAALIICWSGSQSSPNQASNAAITSAPAGMSFTQLARVEAGRRCHYCWIAVNTSGSTINGTYTVEAQPTGGGTFGGHIISFDLANPVNTSTPNSTVQSAYGVSVTSITLSSVGSPSSNDGVFAFGSSQNTGSGMALESSFTELSSGVSGTNVRQAKTGYDVTATIDDTLTVTLGGTINGIAVAFIVYGSASASFKAAWARGANQICS